MKIVTTHPTASGIETHKGPSLGLVACVTIVLFTLNVLAYNVLTDGARYPRPLESAGAARDYFQRFPGVLRISSFFQLGAAISIGIFTATITSLLRFLGQKVAGVNIALFGGITGATFLAVSSVLTWVQSHPDISGNLSTMRVVQLAVFASGGTVHVALLGLLLAGISIPCLLSDLMPKWLCWLGLLTAAVSELVSLGFIFSDFFILLPVARFASLLWLAGAGFKITKIRTVIT